MEKIRYETFREQNPGMFPMCTDLIHEYKDEKQVSPT